MEQRKLTDQANTVADLAKVCICCTFPNFSKLSYEIYAHILNQKCLLLIANSLECLAFSVQKDMCAEFDTRLFSHLSAEERKCLCSP